MNLNEARSSLVDALATTGLRVATDPAASHAPCVLVGPVAEVEVVGSCAFTVSLTVHLIAQAPANDKAVTWLAANLPAVLAALLPACEVGVATLATIDVGQGGLPSFDIPTSLTIKE